MHDRGGGVAVIFALVLPVLLVLVGSGIDFAQATIQRQRLQEIVDNSALAAARELGLADARRENVSAAVEAMVKNMLAINGSGGGLQALSVSVASEPLEVTVRARQLTRSYFGAAFGLMSVEFEVVSVARVVGRPNICVLGLDPQASGTIDLQRQARVTGQNCAVSSNSRHANGIRSKNNASLTASFICSAGGRDGGPGNFQPTPMTDCPTFDDPLASRPEPDVGACVGGSASAATSTTLRPGTYCGGLVVKTGADVTLDPGVYVIKDGPLVVEDGARLSGQGVGFLLTGTGARVLFSRGSSIDLAAATGGSMAGLLLFEGRRQPTTGLHQILSDNARNLLGTIYLSRGQLHVDADAPVADKSAYTAIVVRMLTLYGGPHLVLNTNYDLTNVPVPDGIKGAGQPAALTR